MNNQCKSLMYLLPILLAGVGRSDIEPHADQYSSIALPDISIETMRHSVGFDPYESYAPDFMTVTQYNEHGMIRRTMRTRDVSAVLAEVGIILALEVVRDMPQVPAAVLAAA